MIFVQKLIYVFAVHTWKQHLYVQAQCPQIRCVYMKHYQILLYLIVGVLVFVFCFYAAVQLKSFKPSGIVKTSFLSLFFFFFLLQSNI